MEKLIDLLTYVLFHFTVYSSKTFLRSPLSSIHLKLNKIFFKRFYKSYSKYLDIHIQLYSLRFLIYHVLIQKNELASDKYIRDLSIFRITLSLISLRSRCTVGAF
jgi:hypothetical protein